MTTTTMQKTRVVTLIICLHKTLAALHVSIQLFLNICEIETADLFDHVYECLFMTALL